MHIEICSHLNGATTGWLYSHAYNGWYDRTLHVKEMWAGDQKAYERFKEYNVSYMLREWHMTVNEAFLSEVPISHRSALLAHTTHHLMTHATRRRTRTR